MTNSRILVLAGGGFLSNAVRAYMSARGWEVRLLTRNLEQQGPGIYHWDGCSEGDWQRALEGSEVLINFCGRSVNCRYSERNRREILDSRVNPTRALATAMRRVNSGPKVWLNASSATWYRDAEEKSMDEWSGEKGKGFSVNVCQAWEDAMQGESLAEVRQVILRITMVLGHEKNSVYPVLSNLVRRGLGGRQGSGVQFVSWIHQHDFVRALEFLIDSDLQGPVNIAAPNPVTNHCFMRQLRKSLGWKIGLPASDWMIEVGALFMRTESELVLKSRRVIPGQLLKAGFSFHYPTCSQAFEQLRRG